MNDDDFYDDSDEDESEELDEDMPDEDEAEELVRQSDRIMEISRRAGPLRRLLESIELLLCLLKDWITGQYRHVPYRVIAGVVVTLTYLVNPADLVPDFIPAAGFVDDAAIIAAFLLWAKKDIELYKRWRQGNANYTVKNIEDICPGGDPSKIRIDRRVYSEGEVREVSDEESDS